MQAKNIIRQTTGDAFKKENSRKPANESLFKVPPLIS